MPDRQLIVIGNGPDFEKTKAIAKSNVTMMGYQPFEVLKDKMQHAKAFVFAAEEDFGITPVEAQACGTPVIAYGRGGALETVKDGETGCFFKEQTVESVVKAVCDFDAKEGITSEKCRKNAETFSIETFRKAFQAYAQNKMDAEHLS